MKKLNIFFVIFYVFNVHSQESDVSKNLLKMYDSYISLGDEKSLELLNKKTQVLSKENKLSDQVLQKYMQVEHYLQVKNKLSDCLKNSKDELAMHLENAITGAMGQSLFNNGYVGLKAGCDIQFTGPIDQLGFNQLLESMQSDDQYRYYSTVQEKLYQNAMNNAQETYADLLSYEYKGEPKSWKSFLEKELKTKFCQKAGKEIKSEVVHTDNIDLRLDRANIICAEIAKKVSEKISKRQRIPLDKAADYLNTMVDELNDKAYKAALSNNDEDYNAYISSYQAMISYSPGTLVLTDTLQDSQLGIGPIIAKEKLRDRYIFSRHKTIDIDKDAHFPLLIKALEEAKTKTLKGISQIHQDFHQKNYDDEDSNKFFNLIEGKIKSRRQGDIEDLVRYYPSAAGQLLAENPQAVYTVCQAILDAEKSKRNRKNIDKAVMWGGIIVGGALALTFVGSAAGVAIMGSAASIGGLSLVAVGTTAGTIGIGVGLLETSYHTTRSIQNYNEHKRYESALYTSNSNNLIELEASYKRFKESMINAGVAFGFSAVDLGALKYISKLKPKQINALADQVDNLARNADKVDLAGAKNLDDVLKQEKIIKVADEVPLKPRHLDYKNIPFSELQFEEKILRWGHIQKDKLHRFLNTLHANSIGSGSSTHTGLLNDDSKVFLDGLMNKQVDDIVVQHATQTENIIIIKELQFKDLDQMVRVGGSQKLPYNIKIKRGVNDFTFTQKDIEYDFVTRKKPDEIIVNQYNEPVKVVYGELSPFEATQVLDNIDREKIARLVTKELTEEVEKNPSFAKYLEKVMQDIEATK